jgi:hypothetical protein
MRGFKSFDAAGRFCHKQGELRNLLRHHSRHNQIVSFPSAVPASPTQRASRSGPSRDLGDHDDGIGPVGYVAGWGFTDGMDAAFGWDRA